MVNANLGPAYDLAKRLAGMEQNLKNLATQPVLQNASTGQIGDGTAGLSTAKDGMRIFNSAGTLVQYTQTVDGTTICYDATGQAQVRTGALISDPGNFGLEIWTGSTWQKVVGALSVAWSAVSAKPAWGGNDSTIAGSYISGTVANATNASVTATATNADGSAYAYNNNVPGTSFYSVWVGNDGSNHFGKNVSSIRYKTNVRAHTIDPAEVLKLQPVLFDRLPVLVPPDAGKLGPSNMVTGPKNEFGMIAEQVNEHLPEIVQWYDSEIDGIRFDLLPVAQQSVLIDHDGRIAALESQLAAAIARITALERQVQAPAASWSPPEPTVKRHTPPLWAPNVPAYAAPKIQPKPLPYTIQS